MKRKNKNKDTILVALCKILVKPILAQLPLNWFGSSWLDTIWDVDNYPICSYVVNKAFSYYDNAGKEHTVDRGYIIWCRFNKKESVDIETWEQLSRDSGRWACYNITVAVWADISINVVLIDEPE